MTGYRTIGIDCDGRGVARLRLDRPDKHNAIDGTMIRELAAATDALARDATVRVVVLGSDGRSFCAGADLGWMRSQVEADRQARLAEATALAAVFAGLDRLPKPLIARVHGAAYGGGVGLLAVADIVVAAATARFALTETHLGLIPASIEPYILRRVGEGNARRILISGHPFDAAEAWRLGLVSRVIDGAALDRAVEEEVALVLECAPGAIAETKRLALDLARRPDAEPAGLTAERLADRWESAEAQQGITAFFNRTRPPWSAADGDGSGGET